ncbi:MAG: hypothetical protein ISR54_04485 [Chlorobium phaeobacteroides]|uniref:Uncharacterized protein n=1 Tax=Chlorobium phaeobacteroides (strain BS1) TaxID=331678 RepID=B3EQH7_CHLPB|nr:hypothetical protein [Chlorobium phaeobacteroides]MBL6956064.1 hypothetical protein [Chlorobium phaeobacteroides]
MPDTDTNLQSNTLLTAVGIGSAALLFPPIGVPLVIHAVSGALVGGIGIAAAGVLLGPVISNMPQIKPGQPQNDSQPQEDVQPQQLSGKE